MAFQGRGQQCTKLLLFEKITIQSLPGPSGVQGAQACGLTKFIPVPEGFVVLTESFPQDCLSKLSRPTLLVGACRLAREADSHTAK